MQTKSLSVSQRLVHIFAAAIVLKFLSVLWRIHLPPLNPHLHRQIDTIGVSLRYYSRWFLEATPDSWPWLPAILNSGNQIGIMRMEFPLLNLWGAAVLSIFPGSGIYAVQGAGVVLNLVLLGLACFLWKAHRLNGTKFFVVLLAATITTPWDTFISKFMPDIPAHLLVLCAIGLSWEKPRFWGSAILASLGVMMKPPSIVLFALFYLHPKYLSQIKRNLFWIGIPFLAAVFYYTWCLNWIGARQVLPDLFNIHPGNPLSRLKDFFSDFDSFLNFVAFQLFGYLGIIPILWATFFSSEKNFLLKQRKILLLILVQLLVLAALDGSHMYVHNYYLFSVTITGLILTIHSIKYLPNWFQNWMIPLIIFARLIDVAQTESRLIPSDLDLSRRQFWEDCQDLKQELPQVPWNQGYAFRAPDSSYPLYGLCFREITHSATAKYGFYASSADAQAAGCKSIASKSTVTVAECD